MSVFIFINGKKDFDPYDRTLHTHAQVLVCLYGLSQEYWESIFYWKITYGIGAPLQLDKLTNEGIFGHFARVLVDTSQKTCHHGYWLNAKSIHLR